MHIRRSSVLALSAISLASLAAALPHTAYAQDAQTSADGGAATDGTSETIAAEDIIVTGSARTQRRFDVAYAINSLSQDDVLRIAPKSFADLLGTVPGIQVEATGGEVQNVTRVRGIPTDRGYLIFQQDGLPLYHEIDGPFFNSGEGMHRFDLMTERTEIVRGGPAPIYASSAAAIANNITASGGEEPRGKAQVTVGDTELYRLDLMQTGKLADRTYFAIGGFYRRHEEGYRDSGFPSDKGGQIRANIKRETDNGFVKISAMYVNDHNTFYLPIPISDPRNPTVSLDPFIDYHRGTLNSPALRNVNIRFRRGVGGVESYNRDLADGRHMRFFNAGVQYEGDLDGWLVSAKVGFTKGKSSFDAFYSTTNPSDANAFAAGTNLTNARTAFGPRVARLGYTLAGTSTVYDPYADSGLVVSGQYRMSESDFYSAQGDFSFTRKIETGLGTHDLRVGAYTAFWGNDLLQAYQDMLIEVRSQPRLLDLNAYSATGAVLGSVTQNGVLRYTTTLNQGEGDARMIAFYANDTWDVTEGLRIDAGIRHERYGYNGYAIPSVGPVNLGDRTTLADDQTRGLPSTVLRQELNPTATNWTVGASYDFSSNLGVYGRISNLEVPPQLGVVTSINPTIVKTKARQIEAGIKASFGRNYLYATGFYTKFDPFNASFAAFNPDTGRNDQVLPFLGEATVKGVEIDGQIAPVRWFTLTGSVTRQEPEYNNLVNNSGADPSAVEGNQIIREAKFFGNLRPAFNFAVGEAELELFGRFDWVGKRYVDLFNRTAMPGYETLGAGVAVNYADWRLQVVGDNLTNAKGLTEGNTRTDQFAGQGTTEAIYGRPLFGRNFRLILSRSW